MFQRPVAVPYAREEEEEVSCLDAGLASNVAAEEPFPLQQVDHLVFIQFTPFVHIEEIAVGMALGGIMVIDPYFVVAHRTYRQAPLGITVVGNQIFAFLHNRSVLECLLLVGTTKWPYHMRQSRALLSILFVKMLKTISQP